jgi:hypothetical protein
VMENYLDQNKLQKFEDTQDLELFRLGLEIYKSMKTDKTKEVYILVNGADIFFEKYPFLNIMDLNFDIDHNKP